MKKGISLITLIITIVVVIILAAVVILALGNNNPIDSARLSTVVNSKTNMEDCISIVASKKIAETEGKEQMSDIVKSIIDESASEVKFTQDGIEKTIYRIDPDEFESRLGIVVKETPNKDCIWYVDNSGKVYLVFDFMKNVPSYLKENNTTLNKSVQNFVVVLDSALESSIIENIEISKTEDTVGVGEDKNITLDLSKVEGLSYSKWVINESKEKLGVDDESKYPNTVEGNNAEISLKSITNPGTYYLHVLVCANDMKVEKISSAIIIEEKPDVWDGSVAGGFSSGTGTKDDPYLITTVEEFVYFRDQVNSKNNFSEKYIKLGVNIDLNNIEWTPIGNSTSNIFSGNFDGNNKKIYNLSISGSNTASGLFGYVTNKSNYQVNIENIIIESGSINTSSTMAGGVVAYANADTDSSGDIYITNCINKANIENNASSGGVGGIVGQTKAGTNAKDTTPSVIIQNCYNYGNISGTNGQGKYGGIIGTNNYKLFVKNCGNYGNISANANSCGGIAGNITTSKYSYIENSFNKGEISNTSTSYTGGLVGYLEASLYKCYNEGNVSGNKTVGGLAGRFLATTKSSDDTPSISNCYNSGIVTWPGTGTAIVAGGLVGDSSSNYCYNLKIDSCYNSGNVVADKKDKIGAIIGTSLITISNSYYLDTSYTMAIGKDTSGKEQDIASKSNDELKKSSGAEGSVVDLLNSGISDENKVWTTDPSKNDGYPILMWQLENNK